MNFLRIPAPYLNNMEKYKTEIGDIANEWFDKVLTFSADIRYLRIEKDLGTLLSLINTNKCYSKSYAELYNDIIFLLSDVHYGFRFIRRETLDAWKDKGLLSGWDEKYGFLPIEISVKFIIYGKTQNIVPNNFLGNNANIQEPYIYLISTNCYVHTG